MEIKRNSIHWKIAEFKNSLRHLEQKKEFACKDLTKCSKF